MQHNNPNNWCRIYVHQLDSPILAEEYCDRLYEAKMKGLKANLRPLPDRWAGIEPEANYDMYIALMQVRDSLTLSIDDSFACTTMLKFLTSRSFDRSIWKKTLTATWRNHLEIWQSWARRNPRAGNVYVSCSAESRIALSQSKL